MQNGTHRRGLSQVALRKESVDRNNRIVDTRKYRYYVALRKESVDRNPQQPSWHSPGAVSLSARRAWIEIRSSRPGIRRGRCRSPQGERG